MRYLYKISLVLACLYCQHREWKFFTIAFFCIVFFNGFDSIIKINSIYKYKYDKKEQSYEK